MYAISRTSTLNFQNQLLVYEILLQLVEREQIIIACTQNPNHVKWFCDGILVLKNGMDLCQSTVNDTLPYSCLKEFYGEVCKFWHGIIAPN